MAGYPHILHRDFVFLKPAQHRVTTPCNYALETEVGERKMVERRGGREQKKEREKEKKEGKGGKNSCREMGIRCGVGRESGRRGGPIVQLIP